MDCKIKNPLKYLLNELTFILNNSRIIYCAYRITKGPLAQLVRATGS